MGRPFPAVKITGKPRHQSQPPMHSARRWLLRMADDQARQTALRDCDEGPDRSPFGVAALWENWKDPATAEWVRTFVVLTAP